MEVVLGEYVKETTTSGGRKKLLTLRDTFHYIPLIPVLESLLNQYDVYVQVNTFKKFMNASMQQLNNNGKHFHTTLCTVHALL